MKRALFIVGFGLVGLVFVVFVQAAVIDFLDHGMHQYESGSDERGEHELKTFFLGGPLFIVIWAYIGNASFQSWRRGMGMIGAVVLVALICFGVPGLHGPLSTIFNFSGSSLGLIAWGVLSAVMAVGVARVFPRTSTNKRGSSPSKFPAGIRRT